MRPLIDAMIDEDPSMRPEAKELLESSVLKALKDATQPVLGYFSADRTFRSRN